MKVLVIDPKCVSLDWCLRAQTSGHSVKLWSKPGEKTKWIGRGLVPKISVWQDHAAWADFIFIADNTLWLRDVDAWRARGKPVFGPTAALADLELDREKGMEVLRKHKIDVLPQRTFSKYDDAIAFVKKEMRRFVSKPSGDADKALSYVAKSPADLVYMLERWKRSSTLKGEFILQDFAGGCEMAVGGFFGPGGFNSSWCENWEFKKLMNDDLGPNTGEQGTVLRFVKKSKLAEQMLKPLEGYLDTQGYVGYIDVNCIIDDTGKPWPLEFTCRPGWPTFNIQQALLDGDPVQWMVDTLEGRDPQCWKENAVALGVVITIPDYPYSHATRKEVVGIPIYGIKPSLVSRLHPCEMMAGTAPMEVAGKIVTKPMYVTAGDYILVCTGTGETILAAKEQAYRIVKAIKIPNSPMYRTDIGNRLKKQLAVCQRHGYATGLQWSADST